MKLRFLLFFFITSFLSAQNPLIQFPALSPDGTQMAFNYQGDIWTADISGNNPKRITVHEGYDTRPLWGPDGKTIAFQSNRYGNYDIYTISANGGIPKRLTYHSTSDIITDYTEDGHILFSTRRNFAQVEREPETHIVNISGGTPGRYMNALGFDAKRSPNGKFIAFVRGHCRIQREAYQGPANRDIWLYDIKKDTYTQLTSYEGNDFYPQWGDDKTIYFQSSRDGKYNVFKIKLNNSGQKESIDAVTDFKDMGIFSFQISQNGRDIIVAQSDKVFKIDAVSQQKTEIKINIGSDYRYNPIEHKEYKSEAREIAVSPNGKYLAFVVRGEIFLRHTGKDNSRTINVSNSAYRDRSVSWFNDSILVFISDRDGQNDIYSLKSDNSKEQNLLKTLKYKIERLTNTKEQESNPVLSPNGKQIVFNRGKGELVVADFDDKGKLINEKVLLNGWSTANSLSWSPDSKYLAYSLSDLDFNSEIYIHKADNSNQPVNISMHPKQDRNPVWSPDGKKLMFSSNRNNGDYDVWFTWLSKSDWEKTPEDWKEEKEEESKDKKSDKNEASEKSDTLEDSIKVTIDFKDIHERQVQVTSFVGGEFGRAFSKDSKTIYYSTGNGSRGNAKTDSDLYKISWDGNDRKAITSKDSKPQNIIVNSKHSYLYFTKGTGNIEALKLSGDKLESLGFSAKMNIDYATEANQIFDEAWKAINDGFYDPNFHGKDWELLKKTYKPLALKASTRGDFQEIFNWMLGQINASHMGLRALDERSDLQREVTGLIGVEISPKKNGTLEVVKVVENMPAHYSSSQLKVGDVIISVNGNALINDTNFYGFLEGKSKEKIFLEVKRGAGTEEIIIRPQSSNRFENYQSWVKERQGLSEKYSNGKLGYIHIQGMNWTSFERFERELTAAGLGKEGIVIDVRFNGGGWTTDYLMAVLNVKQHAYTVPRGAAKNLEKENTKFINHYPYSERLPLASYTKPTIALCNRASYSNAEIFSHAFKNLGIGTLVGEPTFGAVISTGSTRLIDGSRVRMPFRGWYVKKTKSNMELGPAIPDIEVLNKPDDKSRGEDTQLKKAVEVLLKQL